MRTALFWALKQGEVAISYRSFGSTYRSLDSWSLKNGPICCTQTSVRNYHYSLRNSSEEFSRVLEVFSTKKRELLDRLSDYNLHVTESASRTTRNFIHSRSNSSVLHSGKLHWPDLTSTDLVAGVTCSLNHQVNTRKLEDLSTRQCHSQATS